jgi:hypothetical protein
MYEFWSDRRNGRAGFKKEEIRGLGEHILVDQSLEWAALA